MDTPDTMQRMEELFHAAVELSPADRDAFIDGVRNSNPELAAAVESLIAAHESSNSPIDAPLHEAAAELLASEQPALHKGQIVDHYQIVSRLGKGGMGEVYLASDTKLERKVALKILPPEFTGHKDRLSRFVKEAKAASSLNHPNILTVHEIGESYAGQFIATEFIDGNTLKHLIAHSRMTFAEILDVAIQTASALQVAHEAGIVHRDIKPENIMLRADGYVKILDFGLAKLIEQARPVSLDSDIDTKINDRTKPGTVLGTVNYMSPEQARGQLLDQRTDIFSLGIVLYEMVTGTKPFASATNVDTLVSILEKEPPPVHEYEPNVPAESQRIIKKMLRKNKEERYQTIKDLLVDLKSLREDLTFEAKLGRSQPQKSSSQAGSSESTTIVVDRATARISAEPTKPDVSRSRSFILIVGMMALLAAVGIGTTMVIWQRRNTSAASPSPLAPVVQRTMSYWITVQKYRNKNPYQEPFRLGDDINFEKDYRIRLSFSSPQSGRLYLLNEGPSSADKQPAFNVLFPSETTNNAAALLAAQQEIQIPAPPNWIQFDEQQGTEMMWLVWADSEVPELEAVKSFANVKDRGVISSPGLRNTVNQFLKAHVTPPASVERDQEKKETIVKAAGPILVHVIRLEHH